MIINTHQHQTIVHENLPVKKRERTNCVSKWIIQRITIQIGLI